MKLSKKIIIPIVVLLVVAVVYVGGMLFYSGKYLPATYINGEPFGGKTATAAFEAFTEPIGKTLTVLGHSGEEDLTITKDHYTGKISATELESIALEQTPYLWFVEPLRRKDYELQQDYPLDQQKIKESLGELAMLSAENMVAPTDAYLEVTDTGVEIIPEVIGSTVDKDKLLDTVLDTLEQGGTSVDLAQQDCYVLPAVTAENSAIVEPFQQMNAMSDMAITYDFDYQKEVLDFSRFSDWVSFDPQKGVEIDRDQALGYVAELARKYDTYGKTRQFETSGGNVIQVSGGIYGWQMNQGKTADALIELLKAGESVTVKPIYTSYGFYQSENDDIGNTYIEIDLTKQHMWYYVNGELYVDTGVVTGLPGTWRETPTGTFTVWSKEAKRYISGEDYKFWVECWMPIDWTGVGIHDASWQSSFGGDAYLYRGSHGCINTPYEAAFKIFQHVELNTPVIIHKS